MAKVKVGRIGNYFSKIGVAVVDVEAPIKVGDKISIEGHNKFEMVVKSMQIDMKPITEAKKGQSIGMKVDKEVKRGDLVYKA